MYVHMKTLQSIKRTDSVVMPIFEYRFIHTYIQCMYVCINIYSKIGMTTESVLFIDCKVFM